MNIPESSNEASNEPFGDGPADPMLDLLLQESLGGSQPPDQTATILRRLADHVEERSGTTQPSGVGQRKSHAPRSLVMFGIAAGLLLCGGIAIGVRYRADVLIQAKSDEANEPVSAGEEAGETKAAKVSNNSKPSTGTPRKSLPQPIELAGGPESNPPAANDRNDAKAADSVADPMRSSRDDAPPITLVSKNLNQRWNLHWKRLGVTPTTSRSVDEIQDDLSTRLGVQLPAEAIGDADATWKALRSESNQRVLASEILLALTGRTRVSDANEVEAEMLQQLTSTLKSGSGLDRLVQAWLTPGNIGTESEMQDDSRPIGGNAWVRLLETANVHQIVTQTASLTQHQDLRCQRCHDVPGGDKIPTQADYWRFTSMVSPWVKPSQGRDQSLYYDTLDGRRRLATSVSEDETRQWINGLRGSRDLARGIASRLFAMVHETPRHASPFDLSDATPTPAPPEMIDALADDLIASDFDVVRCISVLLADSVMDRSVPDAMTPGGILVANDQQWTNAVLSVHAMAARSPFQRPASMQRRLQLARTELEPDWTQTDGRDALLAQPLGTQANGMNDKTSKSKRPEVAATGYPLRPSMVVPAWIEKLPDFDSRLNHVAHLAGELKLSDAQRELAQRSLAAGNDEALILERFWWIIRPES